ncbi:MAG: bifunctional aconitate hydratase 2/2-methylisocitrate dehydratase [Pseudomonadales bacterium]|uniref:bifunctional aconitate hydratase 2/2-methylisocitrate dehydratase n=1 Tax=unclassified Ketobacter TaxID=2639109 RepID=UPI000C609F09|nr:MULTISPECIES: bifunctional aconitate hydratase 2/2-methylisocitrate dehydratase [unclassified Ketobacter]MAQ25742.1 bifunctional aconitate hydratase 2/2-methylisocitrate dehydratase [Pseudomonadales bacterium]MEC8811037.1 bifunctional aconitate hydratase 2/2-methylisocitrate dehydratase [Pseudomonadota bacterium]HAG94576.1 bifunctional aconitate hydratase 2/2-methylisocitrate dehydratase [Gammaproteobacteria bacterium]MAQ26753.1 bifunctional aconitate hydratase 2/2-methylisocitrate dehydrata
MLEAYRKHVEERAAQGIPPKPLDEKQAADLVELLKNPPAGEEDFLVELLTYRVPAGVDQAAYVKAGFLAAVAKGEATSPLIDKRKATELLGTMLGGYNVQPLIDLLDDAEVGDLAVAGLSKTLLVFDAFHDVVEKSKNSENAKKVLQSWADGEWFTSKPELPQKITITVFKVTGETNTDDLSPAQDAWSRPDIPLHANAMLKNEREGITPEKPGEIGPISQIEALKAKGHTVAYVGDVVGTGSSRKSATNSVLWFTGDDIPYIPNKRQGGICIGSKIAPIFFNTMEDAGALPFEADVSDLNMGDVVDIYPYEGKITKHDSDEVISEFQLKSDVLIDEVRAGGRINMIIGRGLTNRAREALGLGASDLFRSPVDVAASDKGFTLAQKMVGKACGVEGVRPGQYCEPRMTTVGSQDTTGPMTRDELKDLACLGFSADLTMQSFCHTAAYPKPVDVEMQHSLPDFIMNRGGVSLRPGDGIIHSWLNRMLLPDTVGTGGDSHTRFPIGISFPAGSGLVAFAAATGVMPLDMPESVLVKFTGKRQPGITLRDLVHAIPLYAIKSGFLTVEKKGKKNIFSGRVLEIEGLEDLTVEQAFELSDASAERSAAGCTITLSEESVAEYLKSNITLLKWMIANGYGAARTLERRITAMEEWLANPSLMRADADAEYTEVIEINMDEIKEPILCCPNDPDDAKTLSDVAGDKIDEVFIGSCMTNIGHFRAAGKLLDKVPGGSLSTRLWLAPPTKMDEHQLMEEGYYNIYGRAGARTEMPGCSLCMGNQARVAPGSTVVSTSTRNFPNRLGQGANVYLGSAELASVAAVLGKLPSAEEYMTYAQDIDSMAADIYRYMNFDKMPEYQEVADKVKIQVAQDA